MIKQKMISFLIVFIAIIPITVFSQDLSAIVDMLRGAIIIAQDDENTCLGKLTNEYESESIFNDYGKYGNEFSGESIWNGFSTFGNKFNALSPFNGFSKHPPMIIKEGKLIGYLTVNKSIEGSISPNILKALKDQF